MFRVSALEIILCWQFVFKKTIIQYFSLTFKERSDFILKSNKIQNTKYVLNAICFNSFVTDKHLNYSSRRLKCRARLPI